MNIIDAIHDKNIFRPFLADKNGSLASWNGWMGVISAIFGLPITGTSRRKLVREVTKRKCKKLSKQGFKTSLLLCGRRSGKSKIAAVIVAFVATLSGCEKTLSPGETGYVLCVSPTKAQSRIIFNYLKAIFSTPLLAAEVVEQTASGFTLRNNVRIEISTGIGAYVRGYTLLAAVVDEVCFFGLDETSKIKSDLELIRALQPALLTTKGRLIAISSPYAARGWAYSRWKAHFGSDASASTLVVNAPSRALNATLDQATIDEAMAEDRAAALAEFYAQWRSDVAEFIPRSLVEKLVVPGRKELMPRDQISYACFVDISGGRNDFSAAAIGHSEGRIVVVDKVIAFKAPHDPVLVISEMARALRPFRIRRVVGDNFAAEFCRRSWISAGLGYEKSALPKSDLFLEALPRLCASEIQLLDDTRTVDQFAGLERRTTANQRDRILKGPGQHDDIANAIAGLAFILGRPQRIVGGIGVLRKDYKHRDRVLDNRRLLGEAAFRQQQQKGAMARC